MPRLRDPRTEQVVIGTFNCIGSDIAYGVALRKSCYITLRDSNQFLRASVTVNQYCEMPQGGGSTVKGKIASRIFEARNYKEIDMDFSYRNVLLG